MNRSTVSTGAFVVMVFCVFMSCAHVAPTPPMTVTGDYESSIGERSTHQYLTLTDSTFFYKWYFGFSFPRSQTHGRWKRAGHGKIVLNRELYETDEFKCEISVEEGRREGTDSLEFRLNDPDSLISGMLNKYVLLLDGREACRQTSPIFRLPAAQGNFRSLAIEVLGRQDNLPVLDSVWYDLLTKTYQRTSATSNVFAITVTHGFILGQSEAILNDTLWVEEDGLYWPRKGHFEKKQSEE